MAPERTAPTYRGRIVAWRKKVRESERRDRIAEARRIAEAAAGAFPFRRLYLYGSTTGTGALSVWSDLDFAVEGLAPEDLFRFQGHLSGQTRIEVDVKPLESLSPELQKAVREKGLVIYER